MNPKYAFLEKVGREPSNLIKGLQAVQGAEGYVSDESIEAIAEYFGIPAVEVEGVLSFYAQFKRVKPGKYKIAVCDGTACHIKGSPLIQEWASPPERPTRRGTSRSRPSPASAAAAWRR